MAGRGYRNTTQYGGPNDNKADVRFGGGYDQQQQESQQPQQQQMRGISNVRPPGMVTIKNCLLHFAYLFGTVHKSSNAITEVSMDD